MAKTIWELLNGQTRFGSLSVIGEGEPRYRKNPWPMRMAKCRCDCGQERDCQPAKLKRGDHMSCGCMSSAKISKAITRHGMYKHPVYKIWNGMMQRCHNPNDTGYSHYGSRGIAVCEEWHGHDGMKRFVEYMGERPKGYSIDRIDSSKGYEPGNVRWASDKTQQNNRGICVNLTHDGLTMTQTEWAEHLGLSRNAISERLRRGMTIEQALTHKKGARA